MWASFVTLLSGGASLEIPSRRSRELQAQLGTEVAGDVSRHEGQMLAVLWRKVPEYRVFEVRSQRLGNFARHCPSCTLWGTEGR